MKTAVDVIYCTSPNRCENKTPCELWFDRKAKIYGTEYFAQIFEEKRKKLYKSDYLVRLS